ncbi:MAG: SpoIIE family protein phosphatase [Candidatus Eremiobacteraeota bacterium]|nr:SpoIIE family protein phosphatase [Candidatus Eremiobacteraeota bacterium]
MSDARDIARKFGARIRTQAVLLSTVPLGFLVLFLVIAAVLQHRTSQTETWSQESSAALSQSGVLVATLGEANKDVVDWQKDHRAAQLAAYRAARRRLPTVESQLRAVVAAVPQERTAAQAYVARTEDLADLLDGYVALMVAGNKQQAATLVASSRTRRLSLEWQNARMAFDASVRTRTIARFRDLREEFGRLGLLLLIFSIIGIAVTLVLALGFGVRIGERLQRLAENARRLGAGEPAPPLGGHDEVADLDRIYREMMQRVTESQRQKDEALAAYRREHEVASTLQRALLPHEIPQIPGLRVDTAYLPAARGTEIGGDWYDLFDAGNRLVGVTVGDVAGHGLRAATIMGSVRQSLRNAARESGDPAEVLRRVNRALCADDEGSVVTAFFGLLDLRDGQLRYASAGHPAPLVADERGAIHALHGSGFVLGLDEHTPYETFEAKLAVGHGVILYTDGIVEVRRDYLAGMQALEDAAAAELRDPSSNVAEGIQRRIFGDVTPHDDSAVLFIGITSLGAQAPQGFTQRWTFDARSEAAAHRVKRALLWKLGGLTESGDGLGEVAAIYGELLSNVARHTPGDAAVTLECVGEHAVLHFEDRGGPFAVNGATPPDVLAESGRGLFLVRALAPDVRVERTAQGNRVSATLPIGC